MKAAVLAVVEELASEPAWREQVPARVSRLVAGQGAAWLAELRADPDWSFILYELGPACAKPREVLAAALDLLIVELIEERLDEHPGV